MKNEESIYVHIYMYIDVGILKQLQVFKCLPMNT
jgi:hypothetical protein